MLYIFGIQEFKNGKKCNYFLSCNTNLKPMFTNPHKLVITFMLISFSFFCSAQSVIIQSGIKLPADTVVGKQLINSLNGFLGQKEQPNKENKFVLKEDLPETSDLLDEMKGIERNSKANDFFKPYVNNVVELDGNNFIVQLSYMGVTDNAPVLRASFKLRAKKQGAQFYFSSPLKQNTIAWKSKKYNGLTLYYKDTLNYGAAKAYQKQVDFYDAKLKAPNLPIEFYYCDNLTEALQLLGVEYKADYNGSKNNSLSSHENNTILVLNAGYSERSRFDPHDLWHERLRLVMKSDIINRPVDEGCAYLYGGSWGYTWPEIITKFKKYASESPNADWITLYTENKIFDGKEKPMYVPYFLNALIAQKIEKEKGFASVMELLGCGKREKGDENYFKALEKISGITKANFNNAMQDLIKKLP